MFVLLKPDSTRVRWLCTASDDEHAKLFSSPSVDDPPAVHCARFLLHVVRRVPLPPDYAWRALETVSDMHTRTLAMYAADVQRVRPDPIRFWTCNDHHFTEAAIFSFARCPAALEDERIVELSWSADERVRKAIAEVLKLRSSPYRSEVLQRLIDDSSSLVSAHATSAAGRVKDPELLDYLASKGLFGHLAWEGDPRAHASVVTMAHSSSADDREEAVWKAGVFRDASLLSELCRDGEWDVRRLGVLVAASHGLLAPDQLNGLLAEETTDHIVEFMAEWPTGDRKGLLRIGAAVEKAVPGFPRCQELVEGGHDASSQTRAWAHRDPTVCRAATQLLPRDSTVEVAGELLQSADPVARVAGINTAARRGLHEWFEHLSLLCLDAETEVAHAAAWAVRNGSVACGVYGLDTIIHRDGTANSEIQRQLIGQLIERLVSGQSVSDAEGGLPQRK